jgi:hypothetical protein
MAYTTINKGSSYFNTVLYTGTGASNAITGVGFKPDWVWIKIRNQTFDHTLVDAVRGVQKDLESNTTAAEDTRSTVTVFGSDGFTVGTDSQVNSNTNTFVSWNWLGANTTVSNTSGSVTSTVSANTTSGFSIVKWTTSGSSGNNTIGHGLGVAPKMIIMKAISVTYNWDVFHNSIMPTGAGRMILNSTAAYSTSFNPFGSVAPTSTVFSNDTGFYGNGQNIIAYCFADVKGYSKFGSYTGNGSTDGTFVYTGFKPAFVMLKISSGTTNNWVMMDNKINTSNAVTTYLLADTSGAQGTDMLLDFLSNGFKPRATFNSVNGSGYTYIYMAFAENPFVSSTQIPTTAR